jgi:hypothetical protein
VGSPFIAAAATVVVAGGGEAAAPVAGGAAAGGIAGAILLACFGRLIRLDHINLITGIYCRNSNLRLAVWTHLHISSIDANFACWI